MRRNHCALSLAEGVELNKPTHFTVSTKGAGKANLDCTFSGPSKAEAAKDVEVINNHDNTHTVKYTPVQQVGTCAAGLAAAGPRCFWLLHVPAVLIRFQWNMRRHWFQAALLKLILDFVVLRVL